MRVYVRKSSITKGKAIPIVQNKIPWMPSLQHAAWKRREKERKCVPFYS